MTANVYILKNQMPEPGNWIGLRFGGNALGVYITVRRVKRIHPNVIMASDSLWSQHVPTVQLGLGDESQISEVLLQWPDRLTACLSASSVNQHYYISELDHDGVLAARRKPSATQKKMSGHSLDAFCIWVSHVCNERVRSLTTAWYSDRCSRLICFCGSASTS